jgi:hypothetical protein
MRRSRESWFKRQPARNVPRTLGSCISESPARPSRYGYDEDGDDEEADEDASFSAATVDDAWQFVDGLRDTDDRVAEFGRIPLAGGELLPAGALGGEPPAEKRLTEASGNEGATYERSYHRAVLVLWRRDRTADVLLQAGIVAALPYLKHLADGCVRTRTEAIAVAERVLKGWPGDAEWDSSSIDGEWPGPADRTQMIAALTQLNSPALLERFLREVVASSYDGSENAALVASLSVLGEERAAAVVSSLVAARMPKRPNECAELLLALSETASLRFLDVAQAAVACLDKVGRRDSKLETFDWEPPVQEHMLGPEFLESIVNALQRFNGGSLCSAAAEKIASRPECFSPVALVAPAIERICGLRKGAPAVNNSLQHLWNRAVEFLLERSEVPPQPPSDWHLAAELSCSCPDCQELKSFAHNPAERAHRFRIKKERRQHLHNMIDRYRLDMTHVTERVGSPQTLVCTKDRRTFDRRMSQYQDEIAAMRRLVKLAPSVGDAVLSKRMEESVKRAAGKG